MVAGHSRADHTVRKALEELETMGVAAADAVAKGRPLATVSSCRLPSCSSGWPTAGCLGADGVRCGTDGHSISRGQHLATFSVADGLRLFLQRAYDTAAIKPVPGLTFEVPARTRSTSRKPRAMC